MTDYFSNSKLLSAPVKRSAFSDRTAYVMAEMSRLAYFRFEGGRNIQQIIEDLKPIIQDHRQLSSVATILANQVSSLSELESQTILGDVLAGRGFTLQRTFSRADSGVQAFLCTQDNSTMAVLAFRGTELSLKDIKADVKARLIDVPHIDENRGMVRMHSGYWAQLSSILDDLTMLLDEPIMAGKQLYLTGHSLGGALAIAATKFLASDSTGACYTFGSPPVGTVQFDHDIKTPIYRIINHVDVVPRLPNPTLAYFVRLLVLATEVVLGLFSKLVVPFKRSKWYERMNQFLVDARQYRQSGYGSYLVGEGLHARLIYDVPILDRLLWWWRQVQNLFRAEVKLLTDHSIEVYSQKLATWAEARSR